MGDSTTLINSEGTWKSLVINAKERNCIQRLDINALNEVELKMNDVDDATDPNGESLSKILSMVSSNLNTSVYLHFDVFWLVFLDLFLSFLTFSK